MVADFAQSDQAAGGRGGPLCAWVNYQLLHDEQKARVVLDVGKVATLTFLPAGGDLEDTVAFDLGPGMAVMDELARRQLGKPYDVDGAIAASGRASREAVADVLSNPYFSQPPPKRCFRSDWQGIFVDHFEAACARNPSPSGRGSPCEASAKRGAGVRVPDLLATALELTVQLITRAVDSLTQRPHEVILCGGGSRNITLGIRLRERLSPASTVALEWFDVDGASKDAFNAAALAAARLLEIPANIPQVTGAGKAVLLGGVHSA